VIESDQLEKLDGMPKSGAWITVVVKPGLPVGPISQVLRISTNLTGIPFIDVPVAGRLVEDISFLGRTDFDPQNLILDLGVVDRETGAKSNVFLVVKGPYRDTTNVVVESVEPASPLKAAIGAPKATGESTLFPLEIAIPAEGDQDAPTTASNVTVGYVNLETTHPQRRRIRLSVHFVAP
jgi:hypothetical protein